MKLWPAAPVWSIQRNAENYRAADTLVPGLVVSGLGGLMAETTTPMANLAVSPRSRTAFGWQKLPIIELIVLLIVAVLPLVLQDYLTVYATRVLILCLFALSFDLVWGYAGIMSFGQAVFFG